MGWDVKRQRVGEGQIFKLPFTPRGGRKHHKVSFWGLLFFLTIMILYSNIIKFSVMLASGVQWSDSRILYIAQCST